MGLGHPALLPEGWTRLGLFSGSFVSVPWPAGGPLSSLPLARLAGAPRAGGPTCSGAPVKLWVRKLTWGSVTILGNQGQLQPSLISQATGHTT